MKGTPMSSAQAAPRKTNAARLFGHDIFISFALGPPPRGTQSYASDLARRLLERDFTVFFSEDEAPPGEKLDSTLRQALHRSKVLVVLANRGTLGSPRWVRVEVEEFRRRHPDRPIVPINIGGALQDPTVGDNAQEWLQFRDKIWLDETEEAGASGIASEAVVERLATAPTRARSNVWWRWGVRGVMAALALLAVGLGAAAWIAINQRDEARANQLLIQARTMPESHLDVALLLGAEAARLYPKRVDGQLELLARLTESTAVKSLLRIEGWVTASVTSKDAVAFGTDSGDIIIVDGVSWLQQRRWKAHAGRIRSIWLDTPGTRVATYDGKEIVVWDMRSQSVLARAAFAGASRAVAFSPDGLALAFADADGLSLLQVGASPGNSAASDIERILQGRSFHCFAFDPSGTHLVYSDPDSTEVWSITERRTLSSRRHVEKERVLTRSEDCSTIAVVKEESKEEAKAEDIVVVEVQSALDGKPVGTIEIEGALPKMFFQNEGNNLVSMGEEAEVWSVRPWRYLGSVSLDAPNPRIIETSRDGRWLAVSTLPPRDSLVGNPWVDIFDLTAEDPHWMRLEFTTAPDRLIFSADSSAILPWSSRLSGSAQPVWSLRPAPRLPLQKQDEKIRPPVFAFNHTGTALLIKDGDTLTVWDPVSSARRTQLRVDLPEGWDTGVAEFSPDGSRLAIAVDARTIIVVEAARPETTLHRISVGDSDEVRVADLAISADNRHLAIGGTNGAILVHDLAGKGIQTRLPGFSRFIQALVFSPDGRLLAYGDASGTLYLQRLNTAGEPRVLREGDGPIVSRLTFTPDGSLLASTFPVGPYTLLHDVRSGAEVARLEPETQGINSLAFLDDGRTLVSGSSTGPRNVWDIRRQVLVAQLGAAQNRRVGEPRLVKGTANADRIAGVELAPRGRGAALLYANYLTSANYTAGFRDWSSTALTRDACSMVRRNLTCAEWGQYFSHQSYHRTCADAPAARCEVPK